MKKCIVFFVVLLFVFSLIDISFSQTISRSPRGYLSTRIKKQVYPNNTYEFFDGGTQDYGTYISSNPSDAKVFIRSIWNFTLPTDLPAGSFVKKVEFEFKVNSSESFHLSYVSDYPSSPSNEIKWNLTESATFLKTLVGSNGQTWKYEIPGLIDFIQSAQDQSKPKVYLSFKPTTELLNTALATFTDMHLVITYGKKYNYTVKNNFESGQLKVNSQIKYSGEIVKLEENTTNSFEAIEPQSSGGYTQVWNDTEGTLYKSNWVLLLADGTTIPKGENIATTDVAIADRHNSVMTSYLCKIVKPNFQNSFVGGSNGGVIKVNNTQYNSPTAQFDVVELNPISGTALWQVINEIGYSFHHWNDNSTTATKTFNPGVTETYTAYYTGKPLTTNRALHTGTVYNQPIVLYWSEHPNVNVTQYQIWRRVKHNGVMSDPQIIATVNRGTTSYVDGEYNLTRNYSNDLLYYDVKPYYSIENTYSDPNWLAVYGVLMPKTSDSTSVSEMKLENSLSNFPNPFNPATNIKYSIKESGQVNIKVFDLIGQQITELVNEEKEAGSYSVSFDASHLPSGVYIYTINANNFVQTRKMLLMK
ncbi:MAG: T9SS C-terminal target domain-containing protein [Ignavibacteriales bacterium]|nr:MAG: T9SS C-terminal target domain-containing protein [Ignavibacteriales bacterium]